VRTRSDGVKVFYSPRYEVALPGHIWPTSKYRLIAERLAGPAIEFVEPAAVSWEDLALVHTAEYLDKLRTNTLTAEDIATLELPCVIAHRPEIRVYLAGADPFEGDRLGGLTLTKAGLAARDRLVFDAARAAAVPVVTVLAGGYAANVNDTVDIHAATITVMSE